MPSGDSPVEIVHEKTATALDAFLSADPDRPRATRILHIKSLDADITVREITDREMDTIQERASSKKLSAIDTNAEVVAAALVDPDLHNPDVVQMFADKFGEFMSSSEIVKATMKPFEIIRVGDEVMDLSGASEDAVTQAKN
jgi:hypothetical protein